MLTRSKAGTNTSNKQSNENLKGFYKFPKLPVEIRIMIWKLNYPDLRKVSFDVHLKYTNMAHIVLPPINLAMNQESRQLVKKDYTNMLELVNQVPGLITMVSRIKQVTSSTLRGIVSLLKIKLYARTRSYSGPHGTLEEKPETSQRRQGS